MRGSRLPAVLVVLVGLTGAAGAATPEQIKAAVEKGSTYLKDRYRGATPDAVIGRGNGVGAAALAGLALLEAGAPADDRAVKAIAAGVREAALTEVQTYHVALALLFLDRLGDPADAAFVQLLGVRLLAGQNARGGWTYTCVDPVSPAEERALRAGVVVAELKAGSPAAARPTPGKKEARPGPFAKLHPEIEKYAGRLAAARFRNRGDDNSNTQFGVLGIWVARKHGVPVEHALDLVEKRFLATQNPSGGWPYGASGEGSPSMTCAGLLGLATAIGRREERRLDAKPAPKDDPFAAAGKEKPPPRKEKDLRKVAPKESPGARAGDPFFDPPPPPKADEPAVKPPKPADPPAKKAAPKRKAPADARDLAVERALASLGRVLAGDAPRGKGRARIVIGDGVLGDRDFYFLWSLERVGVVYGLDKIGGVDWYAVGADELVPAQHADGSWGRGGGRGSEVETAFALLFLARSNLVRDLSARVQKDALGTELRAGAGPGPAEVPPAAKAAPLTPAPPDPAVAVKPSIFVAPPPSTARPAGAEDAKAVAAELVGAADEAWPTALERARDGKGGVYTQGLVVAIHRLDGARQKAAREALAERLTRMTAETLRTMLKDADAELRRGAALAMAMKDDRAHLPDLIAALLDEEDLVVRAARAGLKGVTGQDFGPAPGATLPERTAAAKAWLDWLRKQN